MAKITRILHKIFGGDGSSDNFAKFGSLVAGSALKTKDILTIQSLPAWDDGWQEAIYGGNKNLLLEDLNSFCFEHSRQIAYLFQAGVSEWDSTTTYYKGSLVQRTSGSDATGEVYQSLIDANLGNALPVSASDANWIWVNPPDLIIGASATLNKIPKISNTNPANGVPGAASTADSAITDDGVTVGITLPLKFPDNTQQATAAAPVTAQNVVTGSRASGIVYQNTTGKTMFVAVTVTTSTSAGTGTAVSDTNPAPSTVVGYRASTEAATAPLFFIVLPGSYYKVTASFIDYWLEWF